MIECLILVIKNKEDILRIDLSSSNQTSSGRMSERGAVVSHLCSKVKDVAHFGEVF